MVRPVPIPNTAVKHQLANGSACIACARVGCRQFFTLGQLPFCRALCFRAHSALRAAGSGGCWFWRLPLGFGRLLKKPLSSGKTRKKPGDFAGLIFTTRLFQQPVKQEFRAAVTHSPARFWFSGAASACGAEIQRWMDRFWTDVMTGVEKAHELQNASRATCQGHQGCDRSL